MRFILKLVFAFFVLLPFSAKSQKDLTPEDIKNLQEQAKSYLKQYKYALQAIGSTDQGLTKDEINKLINRTLNYFVPDAKVEVMNLDKNNKPKKGGTYPIATYLRDVVAKYKTRFQYVVTRIETNNFRISDLYPVKDSKGNIVSYKCYSSYVQGFCAKTKIDNSETFNKTDPDDYDICERTWKTVEITVEKEFSPTRGDRWVMKLGNVSANNEVSLKK